MHRAPGTRPFGGLVAVLLAATGLSACGSGDQLDVGEVRSDAGAAGDAATGTALSVTVPTGTLDLIVSGPLDRVGDLRAPDGGSLVQVATTFHDAEVRKDVWRLAGRAGSSEPVELAVDLAGASYDVGQGDSVLALPSDDTSDLTVAVTYDGLTQRVGLDGTREPGPADALYDAPVGGPAPTPCASTTLDHGVPASDATCRVDRADAIPYVPRLGWAAEGRTWVAVTLVASLEPVALAGSDYRLDRVVDHSLLAGDPARTTFDATEADATGWSATLVFDADAAEVPQDVDVELDLGIVPVDGGLTPPTGAPDTLRLSASAPTRLTT